MTKMSCHKYSDSFIDIRVFSFVDAALYSCLQDLPPFIVISIDDFGFPATPFDLDNPSMLSVLKVEFADVDEDGPVDIGMSDENANRIVSFVDHYLPLKPQIVVHCAAGRSRSPGVAAALCRWINGTDAPILDNPTFSPSFLCYKKVLQAAGVVFDEERERERFAIIRARNKEWQDTEFDSTLLCIENREIDRLDITSDAVLRANDNGWLSVKEKINRLNPLLINL